MVEGKGMFRGFIGSFLEGSLGRGIKQNKFKVQVEIDYGRVIVRGFRDSYMRYVGGRDVQRGE